MNIKSLIIIFLIILFVVFIGFKTIKIKNEIANLKLKINEIQEENSNLKIEKDKLFSIYNISEYLKNNQFENVDTEDIIIVNEK